MGTCKCKSFTDTKMWKLGDRTSIGTRLLYWILTGPSFAVLWFIIFLLSGMSLHTRLSSSSSPSPPSCTCSASGASRPSTTQQERKGHSDTLQIVVFDRSDSQTKCISNQLRVGSYQWRSQSTELTSRGPPELVQHFLLQGVEFTSVQERAACPKFDMVWLNRSPIPGQGRRGIISSFKRFLPAFPRIEKGGGSAPCGGNPLSEVVGSRRNWLQTVLPLSSDLARTYPPTSTFQPVLRIHEIQCADPYL